MEDTIERNGSSNQIFIDEVISLKSNLSNINNKIKLLEFLMEEQNDSDLNFEKQMGFLKELKNQKKIVEKDLKELRSIENKLYCALRPKTNIESKKNLNLNKLYENFLIDKD